MIVLVNFRLNRETLILEGVSTTGELKKFENCTFFSADEVKAYNNLHDQGFVQNPFDYFANGEIQELANELITSVSYRLLISRQSNIVFAVKTSEFSEIFSKVSSIPIPASPRHSQLVLVTRYNLRGYRTRFPASPRQTKTIKIKEVWLVRACGSYPSLRCFCSYFHFDYVAVFANLGWFLSSKRVGVKSLLAGACG